MPVGTVVYWYSSIDGVPLSLPRGWMLCDGSMVDDHASPLYGKRVPDILSDGEPRYIICIK
jgi:hypothetical protein